MTLARAPELEREVRAAAPAAIRAVLAPKLQNVNPYQALLGEALERLGVAVRIKNAPLDYFAGHTEAPVRFVLHLHWVCSMLTDASQVGTARRGSAFLLGLRRLKQRGVRLVWTVHDLHGPLGTHRAWERVYQMLLARMADVLIVHSQGAARAVSRAFRVPAGRMSVVPHGHFAGWYPNDIDRDAARERLGIARGERVVLFFGALRDYKGVPELVRAFSQVDAPNARLLIAGRPQHAGVAEAVGQLARGDWRVDVRLGWVEDRDVQLFYNASDAVALPFRETLTSGSAMLGMSFGRAIVAPEIEAMTSMVPAAGAVWYDRERPGALRGALEYALDAELVSMGERNLAHALEHDWDGIARQTLALYVGGTP
jgi:glycosyltransferase involved in cell wall biosynthesis